METLLLDKKTSKEIQNYLPDYEVLQRLADFFAVFSDTTRIRILSALSVSAMCVNDLCVMTGINQTTASHQLKFLKNAGLVRAARQGKIMFYELVADTTLDSLMTTGADYLFADN